MAHRSHKNVSQIYVFAVESGHFFKKVYSIACYG